MSGEAVFDVAPVVTALQEAITTTDIVTLFATGVKVALPIILIWYGCKWVYRRFTSAVKGGRG